MLTGFLIGIGVCLIPVGLALMLYGYHIWKCS
ncbi:hypothetical protein C8J45_103356 [Sphingomonas sp. PP-CE-3G-477]|nr:hypothetical protein C8J45_103356 [Sphingomonas sp. PP-CE-3G-477]